MPIYEGTAHALLTRDAFPPALFAVLLGLTGPLAATADDGLAAAVNHNPAPRFAQIERALTGSSNQSAHVSRAVNTGSGFQNNAAATAPGWSDIDSANAGTGTQIIRSVNANGHDRVSNDTVLHLPHAIEVTHASLRSRVANNSVAVTQTGGSVNSSIVISEQGRASNFFGVTVIAMEAGANANQNVSVNVAGSVAAGPIQ